MYQALSRFTVLQARGGHSYRHRSHGCDRGQEAVKGSRAVFGVGQGVKGCFWCRSRGQGLFLVSVKRSRTIFKLGKAVKMQFRMVKFLWPSTSSTVNDQVASVQG